MKQCFLICILILIVCQFFSCSNNKKPEINYSHTFYRDFDFFERKGYDTLKGEQIVAPCIEVHESNDSVITLKIYEESLSNFKWAHVPVDDDVVLKRYYDWESGFLFFKTQADSLFAFSYQSNPEKLLANSNSSIYTSDLYPHQISIYTSDEVRHFITEIDYSTDTIISYSYYKNYVKLPFVHFIDYSKGFKEYRRKFWMKQYPVVGNYIENIQIDYRHFEDENGNYIDPDSDSLIFDSSYIITTKWDSRKKYFKRWKPHLEIL